MKPDFIGIGAQKCATAWIYSMWRIIPQITMLLSGQKKDTEFFGYFYDRGFEWYERHFEKQENGIAGEYSTSYFYNLEAPERIYNYASGIKLIVSLRHPVERAFSNHKHEISLGRVSGKNLIFENALKNNPMYLYQSLYYTHLTRWLQYFDQTQIFILLLDDLKENPKKTIQDLYEFLSVNPKHEPAILYKRIHETRVPQNTFFESFIKKTSALLKNIGAGRLINYLKRKGVNRAVYKLNAQEENIAFLQCRKNKIGFT